MDGKKEEKLIAESYLSFPGGFFIYTADEKEEFLYANDFFLKMLGYTFDELKSVTNNNFSSLIYELDRKQALDAINQTASKKENDVYDVCKYRVKAKDGRLIWLHDEGHLFTDSKGRKVYYVIVVNITDTQQIIYSQQTLLKCLGELNSDESFNKQIKNVLEYVLEFLQADRAHLFLLDKDKETLSDACEVKRDDVSSQINRLQKIKRSVFDALATRYNQGENYYIIKDIKAFKGDEARLREFKIFTSNGVNSLVSSPIAFNNQLYGFICVDNPKVDYPQFVTSLSYFICMEMEKNELEKKLLFLSYSDPLTTLNNRNAYDELLESLRGKTITNVGVVFGDMNKLKFINDNFNHKVGDNYIKAFAKMLKKYFSPKEIFRISGDEFVLICQNITKADFDKKMSCIHEDVSLFSFPIASFGTSYEKETNSVEKMITSAEQDMYIAKEACHRNSSAASLDTNKLLIFLRNNMD